MDAKQRRKLIVELLQKEDAPLSASSLAARLSVSRQVIVGDVALLRAVGQAISATPRGYVLDPPESPDTAFGYVGIVACCHTQEQLRQELYTVVDLGGTLIDVIIEHPIYGQITGPLNVGSRYDADQICQALRKDASLPLSSLTGGTHLHRIGCRDRESFQRIKESLYRYGYLLR